MTLILESPTMGAAFGSGTGAEVMRGGTASADAVSFAAYCSEIATA